MGSTFKSCVLRAGLHGPGSVGDPKKHCCGVDPLRGRPQHLLLCFPNLDSAPTLSPAMPSHSAPTLSGPSSSRARSVPPSNCCEPRGSQAVTRGEGRGSEGDGETGEMMNKNTTRQRGMTEGSGLIGVLKQTKLVKMNGIDLILQRG